LEAEHLGDGTWAGKRAPAVAEWRAAGGKRHEPEYRYCHEQGEGAPRDAPSILGPTRISYRAAELPSEILCIALRKMTPFFRQIVDGEDGRDRANRDARATVNALDWIDVEHFLAAVGGFVLLWVNAIYRTRVHTGTVLGSDTRFCNYVSHNLFEILISYQTTYKPAILAEDNNES
jgi:hypothetical protein